jgi:hypothetical protein
MKLDRRLHDFLIYRGLRNCFDSDRLTKSDLKWMVTYLEDRLEYYCAQINLDNCEFSGKSVIEEKKK